MKLLEIACRDVVVVCVGVWERRSVCVCGGGVHHYFQTLWDAGQHGQVESLTGVTHVSNDDAGV